MLLDRSVDLFRQGIVSLHKRKESAEMGMSEEPEILDLFIAMRMFKSSNNEPSENLHRYQTLFDCFQ